MNNEAAYVSYPEKDPENPEDAILSSKAEGEEEGGETYEETENRLNGKNFIRENGSEASIFTVYNDDKQPGVNGPAIIPSTPTSPASISISAVNAVGTTTSFATTVVEDAEERKALQISDSNQPGQRTEPALREIEREQNALRNGDGDEEEEKCQREDIAVVTSNSSQASASLDEIILLETITRYYGYLCFLLEKSLVFATLAGFAGIYVLLFVFSFVYTTVVPTLYTHNPFREAREDRRVAKAD